MSYKFMFLQTYNIFTFNPYSYRIMQHVHSQLLNSYTVFESGNTKTFQVSKL